MEPPLGIELLLGIGEGSRASSTGRGVALLEDGAGGAAVVAEAGGAGLRLPLAGCPGGEGGGETGVVTTGGAFPSTDSSTTTVMVLS